MAIERRAAVEVRSSGRALAGYAATWDCETRVADFVEVVRRGAFARTIASSADVLMLVDHDVGKILARTKAGTLRLAEDQRGLHFETADLPGTSYANDVLELVRSGNLGGASFAFQVMQGGERWQGRRRELVDVRLREISAVGAFPAYAETEVSARARPSLRLHLARRWLETV